MLVRVNEAVGGTVGEAGFKNGDNSDTEFTYTTWGSVKKDGNKQIDSVVYNFLGKPSRVYFHNGFVVSYTYDAAGGKLSVKTDSVATTKSFFNYIGGFVYEGATPALSFFSSPEGRVVKNGGSYEYQYSISDHQGNTRVLFTSATPSPVSLTANMESPTNDDFKNATTNRISFELYDHTDFSGTTYSYSQKLTGASGQQVGVAKSFKVYPGDKIRIEAYAKYMASSGSSNLAGFATALLSAFGYAPPGSGETGTPGAGLNTWGGIVAAGGGNGSGSYPKAFVNLLVFDKNYNFLDVAWDQINGGEQVGASPKAAHDYLMQEYTAKEEGYIYVYVSNESSTLVEVYFDDVVVTQTKTNLIQGNEYYPFGMQTANSWTREAVTGNNYLANGGTELNTTTQLYDLDFRNYDPALGRMYGVDPVAAKYASLTPYNYSFNNPTAFSDVSGADPNETVNYSAMNTQYYSGYTYDDKVQYRGSAVWYDAMGWRNEVDGAADFYRLAGGTISAGFGSGWKPGQNGISNLLMDWNPDFGGPIFAQAPGSAGRWISPTLASWAYRQFREPSESEINNLFAATGVESPSASIEDGVAYVTFVQGAKYSLLRGKIEMQSHHLSIISAHGKGVGYHAYAYYFDKESEAYSFMWERSFNSSGKVDMERSAFLTTEGGVLVLPPVGYDVNDNGKFKSNGPRKSYSNFIPVYGQRGAVQVEFMLGRLNVAKQIHTHPNSQNISPGEFDPDLAFQREMGIPCIVIRTNGFFSTNRRFLGSKSEFFGGSKSLKD